MEEEKILESITNNISSRLKVPIIITYLCVLLIFNWDILYYLLFENDDPTNKIDCIKSTYSELYYTRIFHCIIISITLIILFTVINTLLNFCLKWFYKKDKEITTEVENYEKINVLSSQLSQSVTEIKNLKKQIENLKNINESLSSRDLDIDISKISEKDYNDLISLIVLQNNSEKLRFSLKELIGFLKEEPDLETHIIYNKATYSDDMSALIGHLKNSNLIKFKNTLYNSARGQYNQKLELSQSFKDILTMNLS
mgnify:FL=1